jgi:hypothetical protein
MIFLNINSSLYRKQTLIEKKYPFCLTGIIRNDFSNISNDKFGIINIYLAWKDNLPKEITKKIKQNNSICMITWEPYLKENKDLSILKDIYSTNKYDALIRNFAKSINEYDHPVLLRWGHEMNGNWYSWSGMSNNQSSVSYIKAYKKIYEIFKEEKCEKVKFMFSVNSNDVPNKKWNRFENYYPGNKYVDIIGIDMYNWGKTQKWALGHSKWTRPQDIILAPYERIINKYPEKMIIISEVGTTSDGGNKKLWLKSFLTFLKHRFKAVKGFVWFDINKETDWAISDDKDLWDFFLTESNNEYFSNEIMPFLNFFDTVNEKDK